MSALNLTPFLKNQEIIDTLKNRILSEYFGNDCRYTEEVDAIVEQFKFEYLNNIK